MSVRSSHQADWYTSHRFWAKSQQQGSRKVLDKGEPSQGQTEDRGTARAEFCPDENAATAFTPEGLGSPAFLQLHTAPLSGEDGGQED